MGLGLAADHRPARLRGDRADRVRRSIELRSTCPMVDFSTFRSRSFLGTNIVAFIVSFSMLAMFFFIALYMQNIRGYSPLRPACASCPRRS